MQCEHIVCFLIYAVSVELAASASRPLFPWGPLLWCRPTIVLAFTFRAILMLPKSAGTSHCADSLSHRSYAAFHDFGTYRKRRKWTNDTRRPIGRPTRQAQQQQLTQSEFIQTSKPHVACYDGSDAALCKKYWLLSSLRRGLQDKGGSFLIPSLLLLSHWIPVADSHAKWTTSPNASDSGTVPMLWSTAAKAVAAALENLRRIQRTKENYSAFLLSLLESKTRP